MYEDFYGFEEEPFNVTPDPEFIYYSDQHKEALAHMLYGVRERKGFILVTGRVGSGKTTLCRAFLQELDDSTSTALILNSAMEARDLLETIVDDLGLEVPEEASRKQLVDRLNSFVLQEYRAGRNVCVIIDEAQNLSVEALENLRLLSNLETDKEKLLQMVLVGQPELDNLLNKSELRQLRQRITVRSYLTNLNREETEKYVLHRMNRAKPERSIKISDRVFPALYEATDGNPRSVNIVMDRMLMAAFVEESYVLTLEHLKGALAELEEEKKDEGETPRIKNYKKIASQVDKRTWMIYAGAAAVVTIFLGLAVAWLASPMVSPMISSEISGQLAEESIQQETADKVNKNGDEENIGADTPSFLSSPPPENKLGVETVKQVPEDNRLILLAIARYISSLEVADNVKKVEGSPGNYDFSVREQDLFEGVLPGKLVDFEDTLAEITGFSFPSFLLREQSGVERYAIYFPRQDIFWDPVSGWEQSLSGYSGQAKLWVVSKLDLSDSYTTGTTGDTAVKLQQLLNRAGSYDIPLHYRHYGPMTKDKVQDFQEKVGINADGTVDLKTHLHLLDRADRGKPQLQPDQVEKFIEKVRNNNVAD
ncbi:MAG: AAA family ATPase [bacterium]